MVAPLAPLPLYLIRKMEDPIDESISLQEWVSTLRHLERQRRRRSVGVPKTSDHKFSGGDVASCVRCHRVVSANFMPTLHAAAAAEMDKTAYLAVSAILDKENEKNGVGGGDDALYKENRRLLHLLKQSILPQDFSEAYRKYWQEVEQRPGPSQWPDGESTDVHAMRDLADACSFMYVPPPL